MTSAGGPRWCSRRRRRSSKERRAAPLYPAPGASLYVNSRTWGEGRAAPVAQLTGEEHTCWSTGVIVGVVVHTQQDGKASLRCPWALFLHPSGPLTTMSTSAGTSWLVHPAKIGLVVAPRPLLRNTWPLQGEVGGGTADSLVPAKPPGCCAAACWHHCMQRRAGGERSAACRRLTLTKRK